jgi:hypothetical protein
MTDLGRPHSLPPSTKQNNDLPANGLQKNQKNRAQNIGQKEISGKQRSANNEQISGLSTQRGHKISPNLSSQVFKIFQDLPRSESPCRPDPFLHKSSVMLYIFHHVSSSF